jgi:hypothetical protein
MLVTLQSECSYMAPMALRVDGDVMRSRSECSPWSACSALDAE